MTNEFPVAFFTPVVEGDCQFDEPSALHWKSEVRREDSLMRHVTPAAKRHCHWMTTAKLLKLHSYMQKPSELIAIHGFEL